MLTFLQPRFDLVLYCKPLIATNIHQIAGGKPVRELYLKWKAHLVCEIRVLHDWRGKLIELLQYSRQANDIFAASIDQEIFSAMIELDAVLILDLPLCLLYPFKLQSNCSILS